MCLKDGNRLRDGIILRFQHTSDVTSPWEGIRFDHPVDSDELSEQLRDAYPEGKTHRQRKHMAAIGFLVAELERMQAEGSSTSENNGFGVDSPSSGTDRFDGTFVTNSRSRSAASRTPTSVSSTAESLRLVERSRLNGDKRSPNSASSSIPDLASQTFLFDATNGKPVQQRTKKKMSTEERDDYTRTRRRGACAKCRRAKAKCTHEDVSNNEVQKVEVQPKKRPYGSGRDKRPDKPPKLQKKEHDIPPTEPSNFPVEITGGGQQADGAPPRYVPHINPPGHPLPGEIHDPPNSVWPPYPAGHPPFPDYPSPSTQPYFPEDWPELDPSWMNNPHAGLTGNQPSGQD